MNTAEYWAGFGEAYRRAMEIIERSATVEEAVIRIKLLKPSLKGLAVELD